MSTNYMSGWRQDKAPLPAARGSLQAWEDGNNSCRVGDVSPGGGHHAGLELELGFGI